MITGKTIAQLDLLTNLTNDVSIPVSKDGSTYRIEYDSIREKIASQGDGTNASGFASHAEGNMTSAIGDYSHSEGILSQSFGDNSHAEGNQTDSLGEYSHSEGYQTASVGLGSHSEGVGTSSNGDYSHSEGSQTNSLGYGSHSEGSQNSSVGYFSHSEGYNGLSGWRAYEVTNVVDNFVTLYSTSDLTSSFTSDKIVIDNKIYSYTSTQFSSPNFLVILENSLNNSSVAEIPYSAMSVNNFTFAFSGDANDDTFYTLPFPEGVSFTFLSVTYTAFSISTNAYITFGGGSGNCCFNIPQDIPTSVGLPGIYLSVLGQDAKIYSAYTGYSTTLGGYAVRFEGTYRADPSPTPDLIFNIVIPSGNTNSLTLVVESNPQSPTDSGVSDGISTTFLTGFTASSNKSYTIATNNLTFNYANDLNNLSDSDAPQVIGNFAHSEGFNSKALGRASHAEGSYSVSLGEFSHAEGGYTTTLGTGSHAGGFGTIATGDYQTVFGKYNTSANTSSLLVVGNGTGDTSRSDVLLVNTTGVTTNGNTIITGKTITNTLRITGISEYSDNAAAIAGGLVVGDLYRDGDTLKIVH